MFDLESKEIFISREVVFDGDIFPYCDNAKAENTTSIPLETLFRDTDLELSTDRSLSPSEEVASPQPGPA